jgi:hypothetical protein
VTEITRKLLTKYIKMTKSSKVELKSKLILLITVVSTAFIFLFTTVYFFAFKETSKSYSLIQSWKEYYSLEDWNLIMHAVTDVDGDGQKDIITFTNCAFLSAVPPEKIPSDKRCNEPGMSIIAFPDNTVSVGQKISSKNPFRYQWLKKSYLVKTNDGVWKFYDMNGLQLRTYELGRDNLFIEVNPTFLDRIDTFTYQLSHLGVVLLLVVLPH